MIWGRAELLQPCEPKPWRHTKRAATDTASPGARDDAPTDIVTQLLYPWHGGAATVAGRATPARMGAEDASRKGPSSGGGKRVVTMASPPADIVLAVPVHVPTVHTPATRQPSTDTGTALAGITSGEAERDFYGLGAPIQEHALEFGSPRTLLGTGGFGYVFQATLRTRDEASRATPAASYRDYA